MSLYYALFWTYLGRTVGLHVMFVRQISSIETDLSTETKAVERTMKNILISFICSFVFVYSNVTYGCTITNTPLYNRHNSTGPLSGGTGVGWAFLRGPGREVRIFF